MIFQGLAMKMAVPFNNNAILNNSIKTFLIALITFIGIASVFDQKKSSRITIALIESRQIITKISGAINTVCSITIIYLEKKEA